MRLSSRISRYRNYAQIARSRESINRGREAAHRACARGEGARHKRAELRRIIESRWRWRIYARVRALNGGNLRRTIRSPTRCIASGFNGIYFGLYLLSAAIAAAIRSLRASNGAAFNGAARAAR